MDEEHLNFLIDDLMRSDFKHKIRISKEGNVGENIFKACVFMNRYQEWLSEKDIQRCLTYLMHVVISYDLEKTVEQHMVDDSEVTFKDKHFYFQPEFTDSFYYIMPIENKDKRKLRILGGIEMKSLGPDADYYVIEDTYKIHSMNEMNSWFKLVPRFLDDTVPEAAELIEKNGASIRFVTYSNFSKAVQKQCK